ERCLLGGAGGIRAPRRIGAALQAPVVGHPRCRRRPAPPVRHRPGGDPFPDPLLLPDLRLPGAGAGVDLPGAPAAQCRGVLVELPAQTGRHDGPGGPRDRLRHRVLRRRRPVAGPGGHPRHPLL
ncbi:MAG: hypothetical protein AVDCRST_MAG83-246, partial [uncultured Arthrobacter sp.]